MDNISCLFCEEPETVHHLFFGCCVPTSMWCHLSEIFGRSLGADFESVARWWISNKKNDILNICCAALMWCIWKTRNDICFQAKMWKSEKDILLKLLRTSKNWPALCKIADLKELDRVMEDLTSRLHQPLRISWAGQNATSSSSQMGIQSDLAASIGQEIWNSTSVQETLEDASEDSSLQSTICSVIDR